jgi:hypothetical protein
MRRKVVRVALVALTVLTLGIFATAPAVAGSDITIQGVVQAGAEAGCLVMTPATPGPTYLLLGGDPKVVVVGAALEVTGHLASGGSTCQQGTLLQVDSATPL